MGQVHVWLCAGPWYGCTPLIIRSRRASCMRGPQCVWPGPGCEAPCKARGSARGPTLARVSRLAALACHGLPAWATRCGACPVSVLCQRQCRRD
jgi:hypothetical protein